LHGNAWQLRCRCVCVCGLCWCSVRDNSIGDAGAAAIGAFLVHLPQLQTLEYVVCPTVCACTGSRGHGIRLRLCCCVSGLCSCSLYNNGIGDAGAAAIGAALFHLPQLQTLRYIVRPAVCTGPWCVLTRERGVMPCACAVLLCVRFVFVQPCVQFYRCRGCGGHWCRPGPPSPAADAGVRCVPGCALGVVVCACTGTRGSDIRLRCAAVCAVCARAVLLATVSIIKVQRLCEF
jgi:hypothetical protein